MDITQKKITVRELVEDYRDDGDDGVIGFGGKLDIRPSFQRQFVYEEPEARSVINTVLKGFPLNIMYWSVREDGNYEIIDGQQRTISIAQYIDGQFSFERNYYSNLEDYEKDKILNYELTIYLCEGTHREKLDWFEVINIAGKPLSKQELRNAVYHGTWVSDAKRYFSKTGNPAYQLANKYINAEVVRQGYLETAIKWISNNNIEDYMARNQHEENASELWSYFLDIVKWIKETFIKNREPMKNVNWGELYNKYGDRELDSVKIEEQVQELMEDYEVISKKGIYSYILDGNLHHLNIRQFEEPQKVTAYERQNGICANCNKHFEYDEMHGDHIDPWHEGGKTNPANCQMLCAPCNRRKGGF